MTEPSPVNPLAEVKKLVADLRELLGKWFHVLPSGFAAELEKGIEALDAFFRKVKMADGKPDSGTAATDAAATDAPGPGSDAAKT